MPTRITSKSCSVHEAIPSFPVLVPAFPPKSLPSYVIPLASRSPLGSRSPQGSISPLASRSPQVPRPQTPRPQFLLKGPNWIQNLISTDFIDLSIILKVITS